MPKFYMNLRNGSEYVRDTEGRELPDLTTARTEALSAARDLVISDLRQGRTLRLSDTIEIDNADREQLLVVEFRDAVTIED